MIVSNEFDGDTCDALAEKFVMLADKDKDLTHREIRKRKVWNEVLRQYEQEEKAQ